MKLKLAALTLIAFACWLVPYKTLAEEIGTQTYAQRSPQTVSEIHDEARANTTQADNSERQEESKTKEEVTKPNVPSRPTNNNGIYNGRHYSKEEVIQLIKDYSAQYGISADLPLRVASCESGFSQFSKNKSSTASGIFQYLTSTWRNTDSGKQGISVFDVDANVHMAIKSIASGGISNWASSKSCWNR